MQPAPALDVLITPGRALRPAALLVLLLVLAALLGWTTLHWPLDRPAQRVTRLLLMAATLVLAARAWQQAEPHTGRLRWHAPSWSWQAQGAAALSGALQVRLDLGGWMLLEFVPAASETCTCHIWLAPSRRRLPAHWHALRCAVYSPRPASLVAPTDGPTAADTPSHEQRP